ncbi:alpha/beta fold hydrolase [Acuticoccus kandeliae]|uniref:alpha/beta fold hydrolase n=1 Tax=Acuticoccus kandeliae TaxID=2073160 RepID=UPI000D3E2FAE|nr:alpha/beta hydrolase [Acuticoccus kandeliae]
MGTNPIGGWLKRDGVLLHTFTYEGDGPDLLLVPGITSPAMTWGFVAERLAEFARVTVVDVRGRGLSDHTPGLDYSLDALARDTLAVAATLDRPILVGHSMGGRIAVAASAIDPTAFARTIVVDPPVSGPGRRPYPSPLPPYLEMMDEIARGGGIEAVKRTMPTWTEAQCRARADWLPTCSVEGVVATYESFHNEDMHALLPKAALPMLLIYAQNGDVVRESDAAEFTGLAPDCKAERIDDAAHMIPWDQLDAFIASVRAFALA